MLTVAEEIVDLLEKAGVKRFYGLIGDSLNEFGYAVSKSHLQWIGVRHEEIGAFAAAGEALLSGNLTVCAGTAGPGSVHLINGLYEAKANRAPVLAIVTHIPSSQIGTEYFQETHPMRAFADCSVFCETLTQPEQLPVLVQTAMQTAVSQKGPAVLIVSGDIAKKEVVSSYQAGDLVQQKSVLVPSKESVQKVADMINACEKITFHCGRGCAQGIDKVKLLAQKLKAPILWTLPSKECIEPDNPNAIDSLGLIGEAAGVAEASKCDCLVLFGTDFPFAFVTLPQHPKIIQIDTDESHMGRRRPLDAALVADASIAAEMLLPLVDEKDDTFLKQALQMKTLQQQKKEATLIEFARQPILRPEYLTRCVSLVASNDAIFIADVGLNVIWANRYLQMQRDQKLVGSFKHGTMGGGLGMAIGMSLLEPNRQIVWLAGDGNLTMFLGDLLTIKKYNLNIKVIVYDNKTLGFIDLEAKMEGLPPFATDLDNPDFADVAKAMGILAYSIKKSAEAENTLHEAFVHQGPVLINCLTDTNAIAWNESPV